MNILLKKYKIFNRGFRYHFMDQVVQGKQKESKHKDNNQVQIVIEEGKEYVKEGLAKFVTKKIEIKNQIQVEEEVFYNPVQIFNRDTTVLVIKTFALLQKEKLQQQFEGITILDALSASGLRSIRFALEIEKDLLKQIYANDLSSASLTLIKENVELNKIPQGIIKINNMDANRLLNESSMSINDTAKFDVIDLDPYGSVGPFLDAAIHACNSNNKDTLVCITCTDSRVLCGPDQQKCFSQYGTARVKMQCFGENGLRTLLHTISAAAGRSGKSITPLLSLYGEFYLRVFVQIKKDKTGAHKLIAQTGNVFVCPQCSAFWVHHYGMEQRSDKNNIIYKVNKAPPKEKCSICNGNLRINGPIWLDKINDFDFITRMQNELSNYKDIFQTYNKINGKLLGILEQTPFEQLPLSYNFNWITSTLNSSNMSKKEIFSGIQSLGYQIASSYIQTDEYKVNCTPEVIFDVVKAWKQMKYPPDQYLRNVIEGSYVHTLLTSPIISKPDFTQQPTKITNIKQFYPNPQKHWGPKQKAVQKQTILSSYLKRKVTALETSGVENVNEQFEDQVLKKPKLDK